MFATDKQDDKVQKKNDQAAHDAAPETQPSSHGHSAPALHGSGAQAAPAMSHWAEGAHHGGGHGQAQKPPADDGKPHMVHDERYSEDADVVQNGEGRIISLSIVNGMTRITIGLGRKQGVRAGMMGYVKKGDGMLADFQIEDAGDRVAHATVDVTPDMLKDHSQVVVNPASMPKSSESSKDMKARLVGVSIVGGKTKITIGRGASHGVRNGMAGYIVANGKPFEKFVVDEVHSTHSTAFVERTIDGLEGHSEIVLNPGS